MEKDRSNDRHCQHLIRCLYIYKVIQFLRCMKKESDRLKNRRRCTPVDGNPGVIFPNIHCDCDGPAVW